MEEFGAVSSKPRHIVNLRGEKEFRFGTRKARIAIDAFNAFNSNVPWGGGSNGSGITDASGPTYGYVVRILTPRVLRFGASFEF